MVNLNSDDATWPTSGYDSRINLALRRRNKLCENRACEKSHTKIAFKNKIEIVNEDIKSSLLPPHHPHITIHYTRPRHEVAPNSTNVQLCQVELVMKPSECRESKECAHF